MEAENGRSSSSSLVPGGRAAGDYKLTEPSSCRGVTVWNATCKQRLTIRRPGQPRSGGKAAEERPPTCHFTRRLSECYSTSQENN